MGVSPRLVIALKDFFYPKRYSFCSYVGGNNNTVRVNSNNFNPVFLRVTNKPYDNIVELPSIIRDFNWEFSRNDAEELVAPLSVIGSQSAGTVDSILKYFFLNGRAGNVIGLKKAVTKKGEIYYGAPGLILDKDFNPIIIGICVLTNNIAPLLRKLKRNILKIDSKVFCSNGSLEKAIIKKLIPFYTSNIIDCKTVKVEIDDISQYIVKPNIPGANIQEDIKELLSTYKDEILADIV